MKRNNTLDVLKGLLIIFVVLGHSLQYGFGVDYYSSGSYYDDFLFRAIYCFHMPLFMFISGYLFYYTNQKPLSQVLTSKVLAIGIPFFIYCSILYFLWYKINHLNTFYFSSYFWSFKSNLWFLSSLLLYYIIVAFITRVYQSSSFYLIITLIVICVCFLFIPDDIVNGTHKYVFVFFLFGFFLNNNFGKIVNKLKTPVVFMVLTGLFVISINIYDSRMMIYEGGFCIFVDGQIYYTQLYTDIVRFIIGAISSCWFVVVISYLVKKYKIIVPIFAYFGRHTLAIYGIQSVLFLLLSEYNYIWDLPHCYLISFLLCVGVLLVCELSIYLFNRNNVFKLLFLGKTN